MTSIPEISQSEFHILQTLWKTGEQSVREVHDALSAKTGWAYTTTKTIMDRMSKKRLLQRESFHGVFIYKPLISKSQGLVKWVHFFADRILETDYSSVVSMFGKTGSLSDDEIDELRALLEKEKDGDND